MNRALFLDRDGVININGAGYCNKVEDFHFVPGIFPLCRAYQDFGYRIIVVTNQAGIHHGFLTQDDLEAIHGHMAGVFVDEGAALTAIYACTGMDEIMRKPAPGMIILAQIRYDIDLAGSILIGDSMTDIEAGQRAGVGCCILVPSGDLRAVPLPR